MKNKLCFITCRFLDVYLLSSVYLNVRFMNQKVLLQGFSALFGKVGRQASEEVVLKLIRTKCLPVLLYDLEVVNS